MNGTLNNLVIINLLNKLYQEIGWKIIKVNNNWPLVVHIVMMHITHIMRMLHNGRINTL